MATTFRTDPVTGQTRISSDNIVRASGQTDAERDARRAADVSYEPPALRASAENAINEARYNQFLRDTGRSNTNPYGNDGIITRMTGVSPNKINYTNNLGARGIESINRLAYDQFLNPTDSRGRVRGMLREGSPTQFGPVFRNPDAQQESPGGLGALVSFLPGVGLVKALTSGRSDLAVPTPGFFPDSPERYSEQEKAFLAPLTEISSPLGSLSEVISTPLDVVSQADRLDPGSKKAGTAGTSEPPGGSISIRGGFDTSALPSRNINVNESIYSEAELAEAEANRALVEQLQQTFEQSGLNSTPSYPTTAAELPSNYIPLMDDFVPQGLNFDFTPSRVR